LTAARHELAAIYREQNRSADEIQQLRSLATADAQHGRHIALAMAYLRAGNYDQALESLQTAESLSPGHSRVALALGRVHLARAEITRDAAVVAEALEALERALGGTAPRSEGLALYGRALHLSGDLVAAERMLQEAVR